MDHSRQISTGGRRPDFNRRKKVPRCLSRSPVKSRVANDERATWTSKKETGPNCYDSSRCYCCSCTWDQMGNQHVHDGRVGYMLNQMFSSTMEGWCHASAATVTDAWRFAAWPWVGDDSKLRLNCCFSIIFFSFSLIHFSWFIQS